MCFKIILERPWSWVKFAAYFCELNLCILRMRVAKAKTEASSSKLFCWFDTIVFTLGTTLAKKAKIFNL